MGLFRNNDNNEVNILELKETIKKDIFEGKYVEIAIPTIKSISDNILSAKELTFGGLKPVEAAKSGVGTTWTLTSLTIGSNACSIELGGMLIPYFIVKSLMKHPFNEMRYSFILTNNEIITFSFQHELQKEVALDVLKEKGINIVE